MAEEPRSDDSDLSKAEAIELWILVEGEKTPDLYEFRSEKESPTLVDLRRHLIANHADFNGANLKSTDLEFFRFDDRVKPIRLKTPVQTVLDFTNDEAPLVIRYPLSTSFIVLNLKFQKAQTQITLTHSTGTWNTLLDKTRERFNDLPEEDEIYFLDQETKKIIIEDEVTFNRLLSETAPNNNQIVINLVARIKGKKAYGDWSLNEVLHELLHKQYQSLSAIPELNIEQIKSCAKTLAGDDETTFVNNLKDIARSLHNDVNANEATARNFINPFFHKAVAMLLHDHPTLKLKIEESFDGSRAYGFLDYVILLGSLAILVTEAKMYEVQKGVTQNLAQLYTAAEKLGKRKREEESNISVYGIVTTGLSWRFIKWSGFEEHLSIEISDIISCEYSGDMTQAKVVLSIISGILQLQAEFYNKRRVRVKPDSSDQLQIEGGGEE